MSEFRSGRTALDPDDVAELLSAHLEHLVGTVANATDPIDRAAAASRVFGMRDVLSLFLPDSKVDDIFHPYDLVVREAILENISLEKGDGKR